MAGPWVLGLGEAAPALDGPPAVELGARPALALYERTARQLDASLRVEEELEESPRGRPDGQLGRTVRFPGDSLQTCRWSI